MDTTRHPTRTRGTHRTTGLAAALVLVSGVLTACSDDDGDAAATTTGPGTGTATVTDTVMQSPVPGTGTPGATDSPGTTTDVHGDPGGPTDTDDPAPPSQGPPEDTQPAPGTQLDLTGVRAAAHDGYDRVVLDLSGTGMPGSSVRLTTDPTADGSGLPVEYTGAQALTVMLHGMTYNDVDTVVSGVPAGNVASVKVMGTFEGDQLIVIGLTDPDITLDDISVSTLTGPTRLVVDVRN